MNKQQAIEREKIVSAELEKLRAIINSPEVYDKNWRAEKGDTYFHAMSNGIGRPRERGYETDTYRWVIGNYFKTEAEALVYRERQLAIGKVTRRINELNGGWEWKSGIIGYYIFFNEVYGKGWVAAHRGGILPKMKTEETAAQIISEFPEELDIIFKK